MLVIRLNIGLRTGLYKHSIFYHLMSMGGFSFEPDLLNLRKKLTRSFKCRLWLVATRQVEITDEECCLLVGKFMP